MVDKKIYTNYVNQFANTANRRAHYATTGPEIWEQMDGCIDAFVCGVGTGGTLSGAGGYLKGKNPDIDIILADPQGSILSPLINTGHAPQNIGSWYIEGIGEDFVPEVCDLDLVGKAYSIPDNESLKAARSLLLHEGVMAESSTGTLLAAAIRHCLEQDSPRRVVTFACDTWLDQDYAISI